MRSNSQLVIVICIAEQMEWHASTAMKAGEEEEEIPSEKAVLREKREQNSQSRSLLPSQSPGSSSLSHLAITISETFRSNT